MTTSMYFGKSVRLWCDGSSDTSFLVDPLGYFSLQPVPHILTLRHKLTTLYELLLLSDFNIDTVLNGFVIQIANGKLWLCFL